MNGEAWIARNPLEFRQRLEFFAKHIEEQNVWPITWKAQEYKDPRSLDQNALIYAAYADISRQQDEPLIDVRRRCKLHYGVPILRAHSEEFRAVYDRVLMPQSYEAKLLLMDWVTVTSEMKKPQATEYIETIFREHPNVRFQERAA